MVSCLAKLNEFEIKELFQVWPKSNFSIFSSAILPPAKTVINRNTKKKEAVSKVRQPLFLFFAVKEEKGKSTGYYAGIGFCSVRCHFFRLCAKLNNPVSTVTFSSPLNINLLKVPLCFIWPKTDSISTQRRLLSVSPCGDLKFSLAFLRYSKSL